MKHFSLEAFKKIPMGLALAAGLFAAACGEDDGRPADPNNNNDQVCNTCSGETVCVDNRCEDAFPRFYTIEFGRVIFPNAKPDGGCWDEPGCGAPDPEIEVRLNGEEAAELDFDDDLFEATFTDAIDIQIIAGSRL